MRPVVYAPRPKKACCPRLICPVYPADEVPRLGNHDVAEGEEEKIDEDGLFGVDDKRQGRKRQCDKGRDDERSHILHVMPFSPTEPGDLPAYHINTKRNTA